MAKKNKPTPRHIHSRSDGKKKAKDSILIVCEGETEHIYLKAWCKKLKTGDSININIEPNAGGHEKTIEKAIALKAKRKKDAEQSQTVGEYDHVWCVFDTENPYEHPGKLEEAIKMSKKEKFGVIVSNPAFEVWYLCHFSESGRAFDSAKQLKDTLKSKIPLKNYHEKADVFDILYPNLHHAMKNALRLLKSEAIFPNPSTDVPKLLCEVFFQNSSVSSPSPPLLNESNYACQHSSAENRCCWLCRKRVK